MDLFSQDGFEGVIVAEVARSAGVTEKAVFNHFVAKEDLVYSTDRSFEEDLVTAMRGREVEISICGAATAFPVSRYTASRADGQRESRTRILRPQVGAIISVHAAMIASFRQATRSGRSVDECAPGLLTAGHQAIRLVSTGLDDYGTQST